MKKYTLRRSIGIARTFFCLLVLIQFASRGEAQVLFQEAFSFGAFSDVTIKQDSDTEATYINYSNFTVGATTYAIPEAPGTQLGDNATRGILLRANTVDPTGAAAVNVLAGGSPLTFTGNFILAFDAYVCSNFFTLGPTEQQIWGIGVNNDTILEGRYNRSNGASGTWGWLSGDNGYGTEDAAIYEDDTELMDLGDSQTGETMFFDDAFDDFFGGHTEGAPSMGQWVQVRVEHSDDEVVVYYNDVEFFRETSDATTGHAMFGYEDPFGSVATPTDSLWGLFDNFKITAGCTPGTLRTWTGETNSDWHVATNWSPACVPTINEDVVIPSGVLISPVISAPLVGYAKTISVESMAELEVETGAQLEVDP